MAGPSELVKNGVRVFRDEGVGAFGRAFALRFFGLERPAPAFQPGTMYDFTTDDLARNRAVVDLFATMSTLEIRSINWYLPVYSHPMAGVNNIYKVARAFRDAHGAEPRFVFYGEPHKSEEQVRAIVRQFYPDMADHTIVRVVDVDDIKNIPPADASVATRWDSTYVLLRANDTKAKFYFIQDYEPFFFPAGPEHALAEESYRFGFARLCNTPSTYRATKRFGGPALAFHQPVDGKYNHAPDKKPSGDPIRIVFYGRPTNPRNGFGIGLEALRQVKARFGSRVELFSMGEAWSEADYGVEGKIKNLGLMNLDALGDFYRSAHIGLGLIFTQHPSLQPLEYWANGVAVVTNDNPANAWLFRHEENCLVAPPSPSMLAEAIGRLVEDGKLRERLMQAGYQSVNVVSWEEESERIWRFATRQPVENASGAE